MKYFNKIATEQKQEEKPYMSRASKVGISALTAGAISPFLLAPLEVIELSKGVDLFKHLPEGSTAGNKFKSFFTPGQAAKSWKDAYGHAPVKLMKNIPAQLANLGIFGLVTGYLDDRYQSDTKPIIKTASFATLGKAVIKTLNRPFLSKFVPEAGKVGSDFSKGFKGGLLDTLGGRNFATDGNNWKGGWTALKKGGTVKGPVDNAENVVHNMTRQMVGGKIAGNVAGAGLFGAGALALSNPTNFTSSFKTL